MKKHIFISFLTGCTLLNSACSVLPNWNIGFNLERAFKTEVQHIDPPSSWARNHAQDTAVAQDWSNIILDQPLLDLIDQALTHNHSLQASAHVVEQSEALLRQARSSLWPNLNTRLASSASSPLRNTRLVDFHQGNLTANWEADIWGRVRASINRADYNSLATEQFYQNVRQALIAQITRTYIFMIEAKQQQALNQRTLNERRDTLHIVKLRYDQGTVSKRELVLAESDVFIAEDNLEVAQASLTAAIQSFQILLGDYPSGIYDVPNNFPDYANIIAVGAPIDLLRRRPDILQAEYDVRAAFETEKHTHKNRWPIMGISSNISSSVGDILHIFNPTDLALSLGASLTDRLFDGGFSKAELDAASAARKSALKTYGNTTLIAFADVEGRLNDLNLIDRRYEYGTLAAQAARETLRLAEIQYKEGTIDLIDMVTFRARSLQAESTLLTIRRQKIEARIALFLALGGSANMLQPYDSDQNMPARSGHNISQTSLETARHRAHINLAKPAN